MGDNSIPFVEITERHPSIYRLWQIAREIGGSEGEIEDRYRGLLEEYGHREREFRW